MFDAIYFDTFAESYSVFRDFFSEHVISLLSQEGRWSFFNGMGGERQISYDVYQKVVELDLFEAGFDVKWTDFSLPTLKKKNNGKGSVEGTEVPTAIDCLPASLWLDTNELPSPTTP